MAKPTNMSLEGLYSWATGSGSSNGINANTANTATTATTASKLGTSTIGSQYEPIYLNGGVPTKCAGGAGGGVPVGTIISYGGLGTPTGFMLCNGAYLNRTDYAELYSAIGTTFGSSSGTDFRLPLLNDNRFLEGSSSSGTQRDPGLPNITGSGLYCENGTSWSSQLTGAFYQVGPNNKYGSNGSDWDNYTIALDASRCSSIYGSSSTVQPKSLTVRYFIKYTGAVQSGSITIQKTFTGTLPPTGSIMPWAGTSNIIPDGYLRCDGAAYSRTTYSALYAAIGTAYGYTSSSNFKVPNLQSKFIQGAEGNTVRSDIPAGLPDITGEFYGMYRETEASWFKGAFDRKSNATIRTAEHHKSYDNNSALIRFKASQNNNNYGNPGVGIYGNSTTVQPPAVAMQYIIKY